jgi:hypothetical protein
MVGRFAMENMIEGSKEEGLTQSQMVEGHEMNI